MRNQKVLSITMIALGIAIISVLSPISVPIGIVPVTLQTLAVGLVATVLKPRDTFLAILGYFVLGSIGLPVFAGGLSGFGVVFGPTGGFLFAFLMIGPIISKLLRLTKYKPSLAMLINILGHILMLVIGTIWLKLFTGIGWSNALVVGFTPFLIIETVKAICVTIFGLAITKALSHARIGYI